MSGGVWEVVRTACSTQAEKLVQPVWSSVEWGLCFRLVVGSPFQTEAGLLMEFLRLRVQRFSSSHLPAKPVLSV